MSIKILHLADIHFSRERKDLVISSLKHVEETAGRNAVGLIMIAGDLFDAAVLNSDNAGLSEFVRAIKRLGDSAPVAMVYGTPSHDVDGSLEIFQTVTCRYGITVLEPGQAYFLALGGGAIIPEKEAKRDFGMENLGAVIFGIPEPRKKYLLANSSAGKDETEETIRDAMRKMCLLLAAKRREYPDLPCVVLYHGEVAGTAYQNGTMVERGTGISITIDDLMDIGSDYNCLGHLHLPQQIGTFPAFYAGSITKDFGEQHKAGYNLVDVGVGSYRMQRIDWPIPQNMKIETALDDFLSKTPYAAPQADGLDFDGGLDVRGRKVWLEISCDKARRSFANAEAELQKLLGHGAVEGSRVTIRDIPVETVRAAEITEASTPAKKFGVWAENSGVEAAESAARKIEALEAETRTGAAKATGEWELVSVKLRGAIGIRRGIGVDEIAIDFGEYENGLVAVTGANGKGKTTLIENCHPYPQLLTRKGKLQDHFCLRDGYREIVYADRSLEGAGHFAKFLIQIDG